MKSYIQDGTQIIYTATGAVTKDVPVVLGGRIFIPQDSGVSGDKIPCLAKGVVEVDKVGAAFTAGDKVYWDAADAEVNTDDSNPDAGYVYEDAASGDAKAKVLLEAWS